MVCLTPTATTTTTYYHYLTKLEALLHNGLPHYYCYYCHYYCYYCHHHYYYHY